MLVTGGAGFIGANFVRHTVTHRGDYAVRVLDALTYAGNRDSLAPVADQVEFVHGNICDAELVDRLVSESDVVVHFAAESHVDNSLHDPEPFIRTNIIGTYTILEAVRRHGRRLHHISTDEVFGDLALDAAGKFTEQTPYDPSSPYSATKVGAEMLVGAYHASYNLPTLITRGANTYGPYQFPEKIVPLFITNALQDLPLPIYGDGSAVRDYLYVDDHVSAIARILWKGEPGSAYNIGTGSEVSGVDVADLVLQLCKKPRSLKHFVKDRAGHDYRYALDTRRTKPLGWEAQMKFAEGMKQTVAWYFKNDGWWRRRKTDEFWDFYRRNYRDLGENGTPTG